MRILQLTHKFPFPYHDGGAIAVRSLAEGLYRSGVELDLFSLNTEKHWASQGIIQELRDLSIYESIRSSDINSTETFQGAIYNTLFGRGSYYVDRFYSQEVDSDLASQLKLVEYDAVILESLYLAPYIEIIKSIRPSIPIILRSHNIEYELRSRQRDEEHNFIKKIFLWSEIRKLKSYEVEIWKRVDLVATVSEREAGEIRKINALCNVHSIPIGMEVKQDSEEIKISKVFNIGFIGSLDWSPNIKGLKWFVDEVWINIEDRSDLRCSIAGAHGDDEIEFLNGEGLEYLGKVSSSTDFMRSMDLLIVPLFSGSGTRVKVLEAMSLGVPVLSTSLGAEGIEVQHSENILIGDSAVEWIDTIEKYAQRTSQLIEIRNNAIDLIQSDYNIVDIGSQLKQEIIKVINDRKN